MTSTVDDKIHVCTVDVSPMSAVSIFHPGHKAT